MKIRFFLVAFDFRIFGSLFGRLFKSAVVICIRLGEKLKTNWTKFNLNGNLVWNIKICFKTSKTLVFIAKLNKLKFYLENPHKLSDKFTSNKKIKFNFSVPSLEHVIKS